MTSDKESYFYYNWNENGHNQKCQGSKRYT